MESVGFLIREEPTFITIALDKNTSDDTYRSILSVPRVNIIKERRIAEGFHASDSK